MDKKFVGLTSLLVLSSFLLLATVVSQGSVFRILNPRAAQETSASEQRSIMFAWPLTTSTAGNNEIKVDVFVRNTDDKPIVDKKVALAATMGTVKEVTNPTDKTGKATFTVSSIVAGTAVVSATVDNVKLLQELTIKFE